MPIEPGVTELRQDETEIHAMSVRQPVSSNWRPAIRLGFRFASIFLFLVIFPFPFEPNDAPDVLPGLWHRVVPFIASRIVPFTGPQILANSELYLYCQLLTYAVIAF